MKILDRIKKKIINLLDPTLIKDYERIKNHNETLEQQHLELKQEYERLENKYDTTEEYYDKGKETIKKLSKVNTNLKRNITDKILQVLEPQLKEITLKKLEFLYKKFNYEEQQLKEIYKDYKHCDIDLEIYLSKGTLIDDVSQELLGKEELWHLFPEEDARATFEFANGYDNARWREYYHYGKVVGVEYIKCYEFFKYKLDYSNQKYVDYKKELYRRVIPREIEKYLDYILDNDTEILSNTEAYLKKLDKEFEEERKQKLEKTEETEYNQEDNTEEEEEDEVDEI